MSPVSSAPQSASDPGIAPRLPEPGRARLPGGLPLFLALALGTLVVTAGFVLPHGLGTEEGLRAGLRVTARLSALFFLLAFTASALVQCAPARFTRWQRANRRIFGLAFAFSHAVHAGFIIAFSRLGPEYYAEAVTPAMIVAGSIGYAILIALTVTSFSAPARFIGPRAWRLLHSVGVHWLWVQFVVSFGKRAAQGPFYWAVLAVFAAALILRLLASRRAIPAVQSA